MSVESFNAALPTAAAQTDPLMWGARRFGEANVLLVTDSQGVRIEGFEIPWGRRRQGHGMRALRCITALADQHSVSLELTAAPTDHKSDITADDLIRFYERAGFIFAGPDGWRINEREPA